MGGKGGEGSGSYKSKGPTMKGSRDAKVIFLDQYRWRKAGQTLRQKLGEFAADPLFSDEVAKAQHLYLVGLDADFIDENDEIVMERCFEWFIFDYVMEGGETLIDIFTAISNTSDMERRLLRDWSGSRMSVYEISGTSPNKGLRLRDLILNRKLTVSNYSVTGKLEKGSTIFMRILRVGDEYEFSTGGLALPPTLSKPLVRKIKADMERYAARKGQSLYSPDSYLKNRAHKINSWVMDFALKTPDFNEQNRDYRDISVSSKIAQRITDMFLDDYYEKWINQPSPSLDGKTPRESCKTIHGRSKVEELLKELERMERSRVNKGEPHYDITKVRARLGLVPGTHGGRPGPEKNHPPGYKQDGEKYHWTNRAQAGVASLIRENLEAKNYTTEQVDGALKLWSDYCARENPAVRKEKLWLAAVVYTLARLELDGKAQQQKIAEEYGVSPSGLSEKYRSLCRSLDLVVFDRRYTSGKSPIEELELSDPLLAKIFYKLKL